MREVGPTFPLHLDRLHHAEQRSIDDNLLLLSEELEKRTSLAAQSAHCADLEDLEELLHFPEEVALRLADAEYQLFYQVPPIDYLRQVTVDLGGASGTPAESLPGNVTHTTTPGNTANTTAAASATTGTRCTVATLIKRFNEVSAWVTHLIISQTTHENRKAVLSCVLRVALYSWNIGNFNGAMEIVAGLKSNKLKPFWLSITERESLPVLDFLSAALLSAEYERALSRALAMAECRVVPFFGAFLRELRDILATSVGASAGLVTLEAAQQDQGPQHKPPPGHPGHQGHPGYQGHPGHQGHPGPQTHPGHHGKEGRSRDQSHQNRQVFISDYNGEDQYFTRIGPGGLVNIEKIYRTQAVMDHISLFHQHYHTRNRLYPTANLIDYLRSSGPSPEQYRIVRESPPDKVELDGEYEIETDAYHPVQPLPHDHGVTYVSLSSSHSKIDQNIIQMLHHGSTVVAWEGSDGGPSVTAPGRGILLYMRLDRSCSTLTWVRPSWSGLRGMHSSGGSATSGGPGGEFDSSVPDYNLSFNPEETLSPGLLTKLALQAAAELSTGATLDDGFLDLSIVKEVYLGVRDSDKEQEFLANCRRFGLEGLPNKECCLTVLYGYGLSDNRFLYIVCPPVLCRLWFTGLCWVVRALARQRRLSDRRVLWLREQYMQLYHEDGYCCGPLAADAIRAFGGRDWSLAGMTQTGVQPGEASGALRREVSMKIKKKQLLSNQTFKDRSLRSQFVEPVTMCMESSYWRNPTQHRQSTPTAFLEHQPDVARHHSLGHLAYTQPKFERERHGSTEHLWHGRHPRVGSILYDTQLDFVDFVTLFRSFSLLIRKDLRDLFEQLAISYRSIAVTATAKVNGVKGSVNGNAKKPHKIGLLTRNSRQDLEGSSLNSQKKIYDAIAAASIFTNCAGIDTNNSQVITISTFTKFLETRQMEIWSEDDVRMLIHRHEPDPLLRSQNCLSFEGFAKYLMDKDNYAFVNERTVPCDADMNRSISHYYIASSHNTYLTGHQLKGESSVELYSQVLLTGCRCVELDCWDGDDGYPMIYHGHTFTTKIPFSAVVETIDRNAFISSPYPIILSIENHCSLQQQTRMAHIFQRIFGEKLVTNFLFEADYSEDPVLPSPAQLRHRILIKNKKLIMEVPAPISSFVSAIGTPVRPSSYGVRHSVPGRTSSIISNASSSSFNDDFSDDDFDDEDDDDNMDDKPIHGVPAITDSPRPSVGMVSHISAKSSSTKRTVPDDKIKKRSSQIAKELSDMVIYIQAIKFRGLNTISPSSSVKQKPRAGMSSSGSSTMTVGSGGGSASNISSSGTTSGESDITVFDTESKRPNVNLPCYQCSSINENTAKKLCRKQPLALLVHTQTQLMRTYPAGMRIDSSNFNPVIFWAFGIQMAALNYQTEDISMQLNTALFEANGKCGFVTKPTVMWDRTHVMYRRFNPWDKEFDGLHSSQITLNIVSGQYVCSNNVTASCFVEVEIIGIPVDCNKQKTKIVHKNSLNPIWNDTFLFRVMFQDLAFLRFSILDANTNHVLAQRVIPLKCLRPGYRHLRLRSPHNKQLYMSSLFIYSRVEEESLDNSGSGETMERTREGEKEAQTEGNVDSTYLNLTGMPLCVKRRMFFLMVYGVLPEEPYTILKITQESTTQDVLLQALQKAGLPADRVNDHILIEEVARGWEKKDHDLPATQRILDLQERPLQAQSKWKGEGRFVLKRMGDDPSSRAWLSSIRSVSSREREARASEGTISSAWEENDTFLVCIYNVSPEIPYAILKVPLNACAQDVLAQALVKARRLEDPLKFVLVEELEWGGTNHNCQQRALADEENVYSTQSHWQTIGRFILQERANATPTSLRKNKVTSSLRLATLDKISKGLNVARSVASGGIKMPVQVALSDPTAAKSKGKSGETDRESKIKGFMRGKGHSDKDIQVPQPKQVQREVHSEGETLSDEESKDTDLLATVSRLKKVSLRKLKEWKS